MKRILSAAAALALVLALGAPANASVDRQAAETVTFDDYYGPCEDDSQNARVGGNFIQKFNSIRDITATIDPVKASFRPCHMGSFGNDAAAAWVAIEPVSPAGTNGFPIIQLGIVHCNMNFSGCSWPDLQYFWAYGGCWAAVPSINILGLADAAPHVYTILRDDGNGDYKLYIDNVRLATIDDDDIGVSCWAKGYTMGLVAAETLDGGDGLADRTNKLDFTNVRYQAAGSIGWQNPGWYDGAGSGCDKPIPNSVHLDYKCDTVASNGIRVWSELK